MARMTRTTRRLLAINAVLLGVLVTVAAMPIVQAQGGTQRARGKYTMVGGRITGGNANAIYVLDAVNQEMVALRWEESRKQLVGVGYRDLNADANARPGR